MTRAWLATGILVAAFAAQPLACGDESETQNGTAASSTASSAIASTSVTASSVTTVSSTTASTSGPGGMGGSGGDGGTGGDGGDGGAGGSLDPFAICYACVHPISRGTGPCVDEYAACENDNDCHNWTNCYDYCATNNYTATCFNNCDQTYSAAVTLYSQVLTCICGYCQNDCPPICT